MKNSEKHNIGLNKKFQKIVATPASFEFFVAIHDFVGHIELNPFLIKILLNKTKANKELDIENKYGYLRKIYQGMEDMNTKSNADLGHERYMIMQELNKIQNKETLESNSFWRKRELFRKSAGIIYERLSAHTANKS